MAPSASLVSESGDDAGASGGGDGRGKPATAFRAAEKAFMLRRVTPPGRRTPVSTGGTKNSRSRLPESPPDMVGVLDPRDESTWRGRAVPLGGRAEAPGRGPNPAAPGGSCPAALACQCCCPGEAATASDCPQAALRGPAPQWELETAAVAAFNAREDCSGATTPAGNDSDSPERPLQLLALPGCPGAYVVPGALSLAQQRRWAVAALQAWPSPPNDTSLGAGYGPLPPPGLWAAAAEGRWLAPPAGGDGGGDLASTSGGGCACERVASIPSAPPWAWVGPPKDARAAGASALPPGGAVPAERLLSRLRWATLGRQYVWGTRGYVAGRVGAPVPPDLAAFGAHLARLVDHFGPEEEGPDRKAESACHCRSREAWTADAAIVNYYGEGDTLLGHVDDGEADLTRPLVSLSIGCAAIFLMGGGTRDVPPLPLLLRSGDAVIMSGPARSCYHGVPRVFVAAPPPAPGRVWRARAPNWGPAPAAHPAADPRAIDASASPDGATASEGDSEGATAATEGPLDPRAGLPAVLLPSGWGAEQGVAEYLLSHRINVNMRHSV